MKRLTVTVLAVAFALSTVPAEAATSGWAPGQPVALTYIHMTSADNGWGLAKHRILVTHDGGHSWFISLYIPDQSYPSQTSFTTFGTSDAWFVKQPVKSGHGMAALKTSVTSDGGRSWTTHWKMRVQVGEVTSIDFVSPTSGWAVLSGNGAAGSIAQEIIRTQNGGKSWKRVEFNFYLKRSKGAIRPTCDGVVSAATFSNDGVDGAVTGQCSAANHYSLYRSHDAGNTWRQQTLLPPPGATSRISASTVTRTFPPVFDSASGLMPVLWWKKPNELAFYVTANAGKSWRYSGAVARKGWVNPTPVFFLLNPSDAWVLAKGRLSFSANAGHSWVTVNRHPGLGVSPQLDFAGATNGFALSAGPAHSQNGTITHTPQPFVNVTSDGGKTWHHIASRIARAG